MHSRTYVRLNLLKRPYFGLYSLICGADGAVWLTCSSTAKFAGRRELKLPMPATLPFGTLFVMALFILFFFIRIGHCCVLMANGFLLAVQWLFLSIAELGVNVALLGRKRVFIIAKEQFAVWSLVVRAVSPASQAPERQSLECAGPMGNPELQNEYEGKAASPPSPAQPATAPTKHGR